MRLEPSSRKAPDVRYGTGAPGKASCLGSCSGCLCCVYHHRAGLLHLLHFQPTLLLSGPGSATLISQCCLEPDLQM